jgi:hypothetical protein
MSIQARATAVVPPNESCRGNCSSNGTRSFCPPLIVLAMQSGRSASEQLMDRARYPLEPEESSRLGHFMGAVASGEFCNCMYTRFAAIGSVKSSM